MSELKQACPHCGGRIAYDAGHAGLAIDCPHCGGQITLNQAQPKFLQVGSGWKSLSLLTRVVIGVLAIILCGVIGLIGLGLLVEMISPIPASDRPAVAQNTPNAAPAATPTAGSSDNRPQPVQKKPEKRLVTTAETQELLRGKSKEEVIELIGKPNGFAAQSLWTYVCPVIEPDTGIEYGGFSIYFTNGGAVMSVYFNERRGTQMMQPPGQSAMVPPAEPVSPAPSSPVQFADLLTNTRQTLTKLVNDHNKCVATINALYPALLKLESTINTEGRFLTEENLLTLRFELKKGKIMFSGAGDEYVIYIKTFHSINESLKSSYNVALVLPATPNRPPYPLITKIELK